MSMETKDGGRLEPFFDIYLSDTFHQFPQIAVGCARLPKGFAVRCFFGNAEERQERRAKILNDLKKGYLADLKEVKATGGKRYLALPEPFTKQESPRLPDINGTSISGREVSLPQDILGKVTLLLLWTKEHGQKTCDTYRESFTKEFHNKQDIECYEVNILDSWLFKKLQSYIRSNLKQQIPVERQENFLCCYDYRPDVIETIFENKLVGHVLLVDTAGHIRWRAHGTATPDELIYLVNCTNTLCKENIMTEL